MNSCNEFSSWENYEECKKIQRHQFFKTEKRINYLVSDPNCHTTKCFTENLLAIEMKKHKY